MKILISSPIREKAAVLKCYLDALIQNKNNCSELCEVGFYFIDDNIEDKSSAALYEYKSRLESECIEFTIERVLEEISNQDDRAEEWNSVKILKMSCLRDQIINYTLGKGYDYLLMVDSDLMLGEDTLCELILTDKEIATPLHWTYINNGLYPNVWLYDFWDFAYRKYVGEHISRAKQLMRMEEFFKMLRKPGVYKVGGLCGCSLIKAECLRNGLRYRVCSNTSVLSEDYYFCTRASVLEMEMYVNTKVDCFHVYKEEMLQEYKSLIATVPE